jgi:hypothetical protein
MKHNKSKIIRRKKNGHKKTQKILYNMKGCYKKCHKCGKRHNPGLPCKLKKGGSTLAYTGEPIFSLPNPHLAYTGKGGSTLAYTGEPIFSQPNPHLAYTGKGGSDEYKPLINRFPNPQQGGCGCGALMGGGKQKGGNCGCGSGLMSGGSSGKYPDGLTGQPWTPSGNWPGTNNVSGDFNHYKLNTYPTDVQTAMGSERTTSNLLPISSNLKGGKLNKTKKNRSHKVKSYKKGRGKKGGESLFYQDMVNAIRSSSYSNESAWNAWSGYKAPVNPLPYMDQYGSKYSTIS